MKKKDLPEKNPSRHFYPQDLAAVAHPDIRQQTSVAWAAWLCQKEVPQVQDLLARYRAWLSGDLADMILQSGLPKKEADAIVKEIVWQIRLKLYKHLDLLMLNPEGSFDLSFLEHDQNMAEDIEALRRLQAVKEEPSRTIAALSLIFSNPYTLLCETVCAEFFNLIYSAMLWRDRDLIPPVDLEERRRQAPHTLSLPETETALDSMIKTLQNLKKKPCHRAPKIPPDNDEIKRQVNELKQQYKTAGDPFPLDQAILQVAYKYAVDKATIRKGYYSKKKTY